MKHDNVNYLLVGLFTLAMFGILLFALFRITGRDVTAESYYAVFAQIPGIRKGTAVTYNGFRIGQVVDIEPQHLEEGTRYRLALDVRADWQIPTDSIVRVVAPGLLSDKVIDIEEGQESTLLKPGETLTGQSQGDIFATMNRIAIEMESLSRDGVRPLLQNLNQQIAGLSEAVDGRMERLTTEAEQLLANMDRQTSVLAGAVGGKMEGLSQQAETLLHSLSQSATELQRLMTPKNRKQLARMIDEGQRATKNLALLSQDFKKSGRELERLLLSSNGMVSENREDLRDVVVTLRDALDTVAQNMDAILHNLEATSRNFSEFSREIRQNPGRLLGGQPPADAATE